MVARSAGAGESRLTGTTDFSVYGMDQVWDSSTWGTLVMLTQNSGSGAEDTSQALTISFRGQMAASTSDIISLRNFTIIRYPAQANP